jgi:hypothetical protein
MSSAIENTRKPLHSGTPTRGVIRPEEFTSEPQQLTPTSPPPKTPSFVLYVRPSCSPSTELLRKIHQNPLPEIFIQNINHMQDRPQWLVGSPTLVDTKVGLIYKGTDAVLYIDRLLALRIPMSPSHAEPPEVEPALNTSKVPLPDNSHRYSSHSNKTPVNVTEYQNRRNAQLQNITQH